MGPVPNDSYRVDPMDSDHLLQSSDGASLTRQDDQDMSLHSEEVSKLQFKAKALEFFRQIEASGEPIIVTDKGRPAIEVRRYKAEKRSPLE